MFRIMRRKIVRGIDAGLTGTPATGAPPPWVGWLIVALMRQRIRQNWHRQIVDNQLRGVDSDEGAVPGLPGWSYNFHGIGCCLTGPDGEIVDVDHRDDHAAIIDPWFFAWRIRSVSNRDLPEIRLWRWMPDQGLIVSALDELRDWGVIEYPEGNHFFQLAAPFEQRLAALEQCNFNDRTIAARWTSAFDDSEDAATMERYHRWLVGRASDFRNASNALSGAAARLPHDALRELSLRLLKGAIGPTTGRAIEVMRTRPDPKFDLAVLATLERISPTDDPPYPAYAALSYLLERGVDPERVEKRFTSFVAVERAKGFTGNPFLGEYAKLALRHRPAIAMPLLRRALRSSTPICVSDIAALLCALDQPWCQRELAQALTEAPSGVSAYIAEALRRSGSALAQRQAELLYTPPTHDSERVGFSMEEVLHNSVDSLLGEQLPGAQALADELRARLPPDWEG